MIGLPEDVCFEPEDVCFEPSPAAFGFDEDEGSVESYTFIPGYWDKLLFDMLRSLISLWKLHIRAVPVLIVRGGR